MQIIIVVIVVKFHIVFLAGSSHLSAEQHMYIYVYSAMRMIEVVIRLSRYYNYSPNHQLNYRTIGIGYRF